MSLDPLRVPDLGIQERAVLSGLLANPGRVISRRELAHHAGLADLGERRIDSILVGLRRRLSPDSIITVRSRGWMLSEQALRSAPALLEPGG